MATITQIDVLGERPFNAGEQDLVFNAYRPLFGTVTLCGPFIEGIYYAIVCPTSRTAREEIEYNLRMKAILLRYITKADIRAWAEELCRKNGYEINDATEEEWKQMYYADGAGRREVEI